jgi:hypothetical protein
MQTESFQKNDLRVVWLYTKVLTKAILMKSKVMRVAFLLIVWEL